WYFSYTGSSQTLVGLRVQGSNASPNGGLLMAADSTSINLGNNTNWTFGASGKTTDWTGGTSSNWSVSSNWDNGVPGASDKAIILSTATNMPTLTTNVTVSTLTINVETATLTLNGFN